VGSALIGDRFGQGESQQAYRQLLAAAKQDRQIKCCARLQEFGQVDRLAAVGAEQGQSVTQPGEEKGTGADDALE